MWILKEAFTLVALGMFVCAMWIIVDFLSNQSKERLARFFEEAVELVHADGMKRADLNRIIERTYSRPIGHLYQEIGQTQACLETYAEAIGVSADEQAQKEFDRVRAIPREEWTRRHAAKVALGIAG
jgi:hypothetical protein